MKVVIDRKKCNIDVVIHEWEGIVSSATLIRVSAGKFYYGLTYFSEEIISPQLAKTLALRETLR